MTFRCFRRRQRSSAPPIESIRRRATETRGHRMKVRGAALIIREGKLLVLAYDYPKGRIFAIPGGGMEDGESLAETIIREYREELGLEVAIGPLRYVGDMMRQGDIKQAIHVVFEARILAGTPLLNPHHTSAADVLWLDLSELDAVRLYPAINREIISDQDLDGPPARYLGNCMTREWA